MPNAQDLTTVANVKAWLGMTTSSDDGVIQDCITAASLYWVWRTGRESLNTITSYSERYDGSGGHRQFLRQSPATSVQAVVVDGLSIPQSPDFVAPGWVLDQSGKSVALIHGAPPRYFGLPIVPVRFRAGMQNVLIQYQAGYTATPLDVEQAVKQMVAVNYKRRQWIDQKSQTLNGMQTVGYRDWELPPEVVCVLNAYTRRALP